MHRVFRTENSNGYWKYLLIQIFLIVVDCFSKWMDFRWLELRLRRMDNSWGWFLKDFYPPALKSFLKFSMLTWNSLCIKWEWKFRSLVVESCTPKRGEVVKLWKFVEPLFLGFRAFVQEGRIHFWKWISKKLYFYNRLTSRSWLVFSSSFTLNAFNCLIDFRSFFDILDC